MKRKRNLWYGLVLLWTLVIFSFSLQPADDSTALSLGFIQGILDLLIPGLWDRLNSIYLAHLDLIHTLVRKGAHFTEYLILGVLAALAGRHGALDRPWIKAVSYCIAVALADETIQRFVEGRHGCFRDVCIDGAGAVVGVLLVLLIAKFSKKKKEV